MPFSRESTGNLSAAQDHIDLACAGYGGAGIRLSGTFTGTVTFEGSVDGRLFDTLTMLLFDGSTTATTATAAGQWFGPCAGLTVVRVRMSAYTSGKAIAYLLAAEPSGARVGGGGGSGTPASPSTAVQFNNSSNFGGSSKFTWDGSTITLSDLAASGSLSNVLVASNAGVIGSPGTMYYDPAYGIGGGTGTRPTWVAPASGSFISTRSSPTNAYPNLYSQVTVSPISASDPLTSGGAVLKARGIVDAAFLWNGIFGLDAYVTVKSTTSSNGNVPGAPGSFEYGSHVGGVSAWAEHQANVTMTDILGLSATGAQVGATSVSTNLFQIVVDPINNAGISGGRLRGTTTNFYGIYILNMGGSLSGSTASDLTATNRAAIQIDSYIAGPTIPAATDWTIHSLATQKSLLSGPLLLTDTGTYLHALSGGSTTYSTGNSTTLTSTTKAAGTGGLAGAVVEVTSNLSAMTAGAYGIVSVEAISKILSTDVQVYPSGSSLSGIVGNANYASGTGGSIDTVAGITGIATHAAFAGTGGVINTKMAGVLGLILQLENTGTVPIAAAFYAIQPTMTASGTATIGAGLYLETQTPAAGSGTFYGIYQAGTADLNYFGGKITTYANVITSDMGVIPIRLGAGPSGTKTANFTMTALTPPAAAGRYCIVAVVTTDGNTNTGSFQITLDYKDANGTAHTGDILPIAGPLGVTGATVSPGASTEAHAGPFLFTIDNSATAITPKVVITGTVSYKVTHYIYQLA